MAVSPVHKRGRVCSGPSPLPPSPWRCSPQGPRAPGPTTSHFKSDLQSFSRNTWGYFPIPSLPGRNLLHSIQTEQDKGGMIGNDFSQLCPLPPYAYQTGLGTLPRNTARGQGDCKLVSRSLSPKFPLQGLKTNKQTTTWGQRSLMSNFQQVSTD